MPAIRLPVLILCLLVIGSGHLSATDAFRQYLALDATAAEQQERVADYDTLLELLGEAIPAGSSDELDQARAALAAIDAEQEAWKSDPELAAADAAFGKAYGEKTRIVIEQLLMPFPGFAAAAARREAIDQELAGLGDLAELAPDQALHVAALTRERNHLARGMEVATWRVWKTPWGAPLVAEQDQAIDAAEKQLKKRPQPDKQSRKSQKNARKAVEAATQQALASYAAFAWAVQAAAEAEAALAATRSQIDELKEQTLNAGATRATASYAMPPRKGKEQKPSKAELWLPPGVTTVRGLVLGHPPDLGTKIATTTAVRFAAATHGCGTLTFKSFDAMFNYGPEKKAGERLQAVLDDLAQQTGHPELAQAALLAVGHSTSGIFARNIAYWAPERSLGVIHIKSGNMHQHRPDPERSLAGVPFIAINGEYEVYGPEGGLRAEYDKQTQWVMIREQLLRRRQTDPDHLLSLVVHAGGGHGGWSGDLSRLCGLFVDKACRSRLPTEPGQACTKLTAQDGWLTDARLKNPRHPPAAWADYAGDKQDAFWHFDQEMAEAVRSYHDGAFFSPDPAIDHPVPADWP